MVSPMRYVHQAYAVVIDGNCQTKTMIQCLIPGVFLYRRIVRRMRCTSISGREPSSCSQFGKSSSNDLVWILVTMAQIEQMSELNQRASVTQKALSVRDHGRLENTAPPQNVACVNQSCAH
jgi:hypothetical protein